MEDTYTHKDLARLCGVSETTIKSYRRKFPGFIPVLTRGKPIRFKGEAGDVCLKIRDCFAKGMSVNETHKVLRENFREQPAARTRRAPVKSAEGPVHNGDISPEYMEKFFETAGQMMHGMAGLATAQVKAEQRLRKVESALSRLLELQAANAEMFGKFLEQVQEPAPMSLEGFEVDEPAAGQQDVVTGAMPEPPASEQTSEPKESKVRARKIVNVQSPSGEVRSYALEKEEGETGAQENAPEQPSDDFLGTPVVIESDQGEFLGVPGRLSLSDFTEVLVRQSEEGGATLTAWTRRGNDWIFTMDATGADTHELYFTSTTTPRGNLVVCFHRLDVNGRETTRHFLQEFFRQIKDNI